MDESYGNYPIYTSEDGSVKFIENFMGTDDYVGTTQ